MFRRSIPKPARTHRLLLPRNLRAEQTDGGHIVPLMPSAGLGGAPEKDVERGGLWRRSRNPSGRQSGDGDVGSIEVSEGGGAVTGFQNVATPALVMERQDPGAGGMRWSAPCLRAVGVTGGGPIRARAISNAMLLRPVSIRACAAAMLAADARHPDTCPRLTARAPAYEILAVTAAPEQPQPATPSRPSPNFPIRW